MVEMKKVDYQKIGEVIKRINKEGIAYDDGISMMMDLEVVCMDVGMDLSKLLKFDKFNFAHDIYGIANHINRRTKKIERCFLPRCH